MTSAVRDVTLEGLGRLGVLGLGGSPIDAKITFIPSKITFLTLVLHFLTVQTQSSDHRVRSFTHSSRHVRIVSRSLWEVGRGCLVNGCSALLGDKRDSKIEQILHKRSFPSHCPHGSRRNRIFRRFLAVYNFRCGRTGGLLVHTSLVSVLFLK
jgi:hypothetical protein